MGVESCQKLSGTSFSSIFFFLRICCLTDQRPMRFSEVAEVIGDFFFFGLLFLRVCCLTDNQGMRFSELQEVIEELFFFFFVFIVLPNRRVWVLRVARSYRGLLFLFLRSPFSLCLLSY
jgi:hypothetical protein